ncbi:MAG: hypothetical protein WBI44_08485 [Syntrophaceticus sp.]
MQCENLQTCPFYKDKMDIESGLGKLYKRRYCEGDKTQCARYMILTKLGKEFVPVDLYPNMHERAEKIIEQHKQ